MLLSYYFIIFAKNIYTMNKIKYIPTNYSSNKSVIETPWSMNSEEIGISGYQPRLRNRILSSQEDSSNTTADSTQDTKQTTYNKPVQETVQAKTVSKTAGSNPTTSITISSTSKKLEKGTISLDGIDVGNMKHVLDKLSEAGISVKVTSGRREAGKVGKAGNKSYHISGNAIDVVPGNGETFESIRQKIKNNPKLLQYFRDNKIGIIDETNEETMKRTGATGAHWHIGPDRLALSDFETMFAKQGGNIPSRLDILVEKFNKQFNK